MPAKTLFKAADLIVPYFVVEGRGRREAIPLFPGIFRYSPDMLCREVAALRRLGLKKILLFGVVPARKKDELASEARRADNVVAAAVRAVKAEFPDTEVMTDVCLCGYTRHGHCGILKKGARSIDSVATLKALSEAALRHAEAGAEWVAPSAMARRQVEVIRRALDAHGFQKTRIMGYSAKFASNFYGPFREACRSAPEFGDRRAYQLDSSDAEAALREIAEDIREGADMVMVKPALCYLDIVREAARRFKIPLAAYNVSGEYAMVKEGARRRLFDEKKAVFEILTSLKRAGADMIITYYAKDAARWMSAKADQPAAERRVECRTSI